MKKLYRLLSLVCVVQLILLSSCQPKWEITDPYENVDWKNHSFYKANFHTHTTRSDGRHSPQDVVDSYHQLGYKILAITDHNEVTYPWESFTEMTASRKSKERLQNSEVTQDALDYENRDPEELKMYAIQANEVSSPHHLGNYFSDYHDYSRTEQEAIQKMEKKNGLAIFNHPGRYTSKNPAKYNTDWYVKLFEQYKILTGMEIYNQGDRYSNDRVLWDSILAQTMPQRPVWGYSNDDFHGPKEKLGRNWNLFILPDLSEASIRDGMMNGKFLYIYAVKGHYGPKPPAIKSIVTDNQKGIIEIDCAGQDSIRWISAGSIVARGSKLKLSNAIDVNNYVRAEIFGLGTVTGTQPFGIQTK